VILLIGMINAGEICIDLEKPLAPTNLQATGNLQLIWTAPTNEPNPNCGIDSGIDHYDIYVNDGLVGQSNTTSYAGGTVLADGTYTIMIIAVDKAKNEGLNASLQVTFPIPVVTSSSSSSSSGGGGGGSYSSPKTNSSNSTNSGLTANDNLSNSSEQDTEKSATEEPSLSGITGFVTGIGNFAKTGLGIGVLVGVFIIAGTAIFFTVKKKGKKDKKE
jgi:hypothetical protein